MLASIGGIDISKYIQETTYKVDATETYTEWKDGNGRKHRSGMIRHIDGSFDMVFVTDADFSTFRALVASATDDGVLTITLHISNEGIEEDVECYFEMATQKEVKISSDYSYKKYKVTITGR